ncbi:hypothetical protein NOSIN_22835 [Nocardiopsis sinuspersici]|uniref:Uncharacterized protein n=1 Tax=Nocardiopsis sinuspersici TaxID=501010 RepID=A0A1V3C739_9ACTN|nr:hypothetical protein NOSIN_22835 [Nocardiopsis sinuspersici]
MKAGLLCPSVSEMILMSAPAADVRLAARCRRPWNRMGGRPVSSDRWRTRSRGVWRLTRLSHDR